MPAFLDRFRDATFDDLSGPQEPEQPRPQSHFDLSKCNPRVRKMLEDYYASMKEKTRG